MAVRAVLLDVDDTLVDTRRAFAAAIAAVLGDWLPQLDAGERGAALQHWVRDPAGHFRAYTRGEIDFATQRRRRAADLHAAFGGPALDALSAARWDATYETAFHAAWRPCEDAARLLGTLAAADLPVAAVTNMLTAYQRRKLAVVGLLNGVCAVVGIAAVGVGMPDPRMFHHACRRLGVSPQVAVNVGDELDVDARGARDAGLLGIWLDRHGSGATPIDVPVVRTLDDVPAVIGLAGCTGAR
ncbi:MAG: HAD family hydrolase [Kineosporiaceae bacterium]